MPGCSADGTRALDSPQCPIRVVHISNDVTVAPLVSRDTCGNAQLDDRAVVTPETDHYGESTAPLIALVNTREARGAFSRGALKKLVLGSSTPGSDTSTSRLFHFRLCRGEHHLPLGWAISNPALGEMNAQLCGQRERLPSSAFNRAQADAIVASVAGDRRACE